VAGAADAELGDAVTTPAAGARRRADTTDDQPDSSKVPSLVLCVVCWFGRFSANARIFACVADTIGEEQGGGSAGGVLQHQHSIDPRLLHGEAPVGQATRQIRLPRTYPHCSAVMLHTGLTLCGCVRTCPRRAMRKS
jgi:hypothetical protein